MKTFATGAAQERRLDPLDAGAEQPELGDRLLDRGTDAWIERNVHGGSSSCTKLTTASRACRSCRCLRRISTTS